MAKYFNIYYTMISFKGHEDLSLIILMPYDGYIYIYTRCRDDMRKWFYGDDYVVLQAPMDDLC